MIIGFDASRAFVVERTGTENYSYNILVNLLQLDRRNAYKIYLRLPEDLVRKKEPISGWLESVRKQLPTSQNYRLVVIRHKRFWTQLGLAREIWKHPPDVLFVPAHTLPVIRRRKIKTVVTIHDLGYEYLPQYHQFPQKLWLNRSTEYAVSHAHKLIAVSEATKDDLIHKLHAIPDRISVIYEGFGWDNLYKQQISKPGDALLTHYALSSQYLFFLGTVQPRKNLIRVIQAFSLLLKNPHIKDHYPDLKLALAGKKGWLSDDIYCEPKRLEIEDRVLFLGHISDLDAMSLLKGALCFVFPSLFEGFGLPIIEAQALGTPVVTSNKKPMTEIGADACEYVNPEDVQNIADGILKVIKDSQYSSLLRKKGLLNVQRFSWRKAAEETLHVLT
ncbi:MAG: glycosyltransferase family 4 protein [bacterium]|nr:glycosyltransferase family 4 protein [bacterium]